MEEGLRPCDGLLIRTGCIPLCYQSQLGFVPASIRPTVDKQYQKWLADWKGELKFLWPLFWFGSYLTGLLFSFASRKCLPLKALPCVSTSRMFWHWHLIAAFIPLTQDLVLYSDDISKCERLSTQPGFPTVYVEKKRGYRKSKKKNILQYSLTKVHFRNTYKSNNHMAYSVKLDDNSLQKRKTWFAIKFSESCFSVFVFFSGLEKAPPQVE